MAVSDNSKYYSEYNGIMSTITHILQFKSLKSVHFFKEINISIQQGLIKYCRYKIDKDLECYKGFLFQ